MLPIESIVRTRYTNFPLILDEAFKDARETYHSFSSSVDTAERLAKLSLVCLNISGPKLSADDISLLFNKKYLAGEDDTPSKLLTLKGIVAINMVGVEVVDNDLEFYLREPFVGMDILTSIHTPNDSKGVILA